MATNQPKIIILDSETLDEVDAIADVGGDDGYNLPAVKRCMHTKVRTSVATSARFTIADSSQLDDLIAKSYGVRRTCRLVRHFVVRADGALSRPVVNCAPHMILVCVRGVASVAGDAATFSFCSLVRGTMLMVPSSRTAVICGSPACELLVVFADYVLPIPRPLFPDEVLFTRNIGYVDACPSRSVIFKAEYNAATRTATLFVKGYIIRVSGLTVERREAVGDDCDCCYPESSVLALDRKKLAKSARTVPTLTPGVVHLHLRERGWLTVTVDAKGECEPAVLRIALASLRVMFGFLRSAVGRYENMWFYYGIIPMPRDLDVRADATSDSDSD
ncbi:hypothetical protein SePPVgORF110 [Seal parapoxvirus]|uniref:Protein OPG181 n=1 Tax=Seal parapoxvirus TaxID=187984 RepID=A0A1Z3GCN9_9POXV|nr:hypothetical protein CGV03_gp110 [Seal parapoxvirus]ASC55528.1 hypothetical protein SePPVgORF110 [Seal parapoxvirus]